MKNLRIIMALLMAANVGRAAAEDDDMQTQMLTSEIASLRQQVVAESTKLEDCAKKVKGFQIAGGITLGLTAVGVGVNVYQAVERDKVKKNILAEQTKLDAAKAQLLKLKSEKELQTNGIDLSRPLSDAHKDIVRRLLKEAKDEVVKLTGPNCKQPCLETRKKLEDAIKAFETALAK